MTDEWNKLASYKDDTSWQSDYLTTDEFSDVFDNLLFLLKLLEDGDSRLVNWKWVIIVTHNTLQGACVCLLTNTAGTGALTRDSTKEVLTALDSKGNDQSPWPEERIAPLSQLLGRLPTDLSMSINDLQSPYEFNTIGDIKRLYVLRDSFSHFSPKTWSIELRGLPRIIRHAIGFVEKIVDHNGYKRVNQFREREVARAIEAIQQRLSELELKKT